MMIEMTIPVEVEFGEKYCEGCKLQNFPHGVSMRADMIVKCIAFDRYLKLSHKESTIYYYSTRTQACIDEEERQKKTEPANYLDVDIYYSDDYLKCSHCARFVTVEQEFRDAFRRGNYEELLQEIVNTHISNCHGCGND